MVDASVMQFYSLWEVSVFPNRCSFFKNLIVPSRFSRYWLLQLATLQLSPWNQLSYFRKPKTFNIEEQRNVIIHVNIFTYKVWKSCLRRHCCCQSTQGLIYIYTELSQSHTAAICIQAGQSDLIHFWCSFLVYETFFTHPLFLPSIEQQKHVHYNNFWSSNKQNCNVVLSREYYSLDHGRRSAVTMLPRKLWGGRWSVPPNDRDTGHHSAPPQGAHRDPQFRPSLAAPTHHH